MGIIQILILATQFGFEKNLNFLAIFRHFGHCATPLPVELLISVGKFGQFLTPPPLKIPRSYMDGPLRWDKTESILGTDSDKNFED